MYLLSGDAEYIAHRKKYEQYRTWKDWLSAIWNAQHNACVIADFEERMSELLDVATCGQLSKPYYEINSIIKSMIEDEFTKSYEEGYKDALRDYNIKEEK